MLNLLLQSTSLMALFPSPPLQMQRACMCHTRLSIPAAAEDDRAPAVLRLALQGLVPALARSDQLHLMATLTEPLHHLADGVRHTVNFRWVSLGDNRNSQDAVHESRLWGLGVHRR